MSPYAPPSPSEPRPGVIVLVGATGDLAMRMLFASLYRLDADGRLDAGLKIVGVARAVHSREDMLGEIRAALQQRLGADEVGEDAWARFAARFDYLQADMTVEEGAQALKAWLAESGLSEEGKVFYLAVSPKLYARIAGSIGEAGLAGGSRVVLEKPIGRDLGSARELNAAVGAVFPEERTFRIDHYLGKETVQNLIALRFANALFEPLWTSVSIDHVEITVAETEGVGERWPYYDEFGASGDMLQNHMLQLLALIAMEPPSDLGPEAVRAEKVKVFRSLRPFDETSAAANVVRGQYGPGVVEGAQVKAYAEERGEASNTETLIAMRVDIDNWRWAGTPFFLRTGKRLPERRTQIVVQFKPVPHSIFGPATTAKLDANRLVIDLQPQEDIRLSLMNRVAGASIEQMALKPLELSLGLGAALHPGKKRRIAYERLILDVLEDNRTLFVSRDEVEAAWAWLDTASEAWTAAGTAPKSYSAGSWGPPAAFKLIEQLGPRVERVSAMHPKVAEVTAAIVDRSRENRAAYLARIDEAGRSKPGRGKLSCANWAHAFAAAPAGDKLKALDPNAPNVGVVTAYNDMLSAHQPYERYPPIIREAARAAGATAQVAGGVPAMCDGVTQGRPGMELSLFSREVIALSTAVALSYDAFDAALYLGICDKIVPGLLIGALTFGHLPAIFVPSGPMSSGLSNADKAKTRALYAEGKIGRDELLASEQKSYHGPGTCTFYGTANSNQMLMEVMGLHLPGAAFVPPDTPLRDALTVAAVKRAVELKLGGNAYTPIGHVIDEKAIVNGIVGLLATGGSTNHTLHLVAAAAAAGIDLRWEDIDALSHVTPLIAKVYPNGEHDVNRFQAAGGVAVVIREMLKAGLMHEDVLTVAGHGLSHYASEPVLGEDGAVSWRGAPDGSLDPEVLASADHPFQPDGGLRMLNGGLGRGVVKTSAVKPQHRKVDAPCVVFDTQEALVEAFGKGELDGRDLVAVVRFQGPAANGMPELHNLTPALGVLLDRGHRVALVTDGRMSGASGKVPAAIHVTPEAARGGPLARVRTGDRIRLDLENGELEIFVDEAEFAARDPAPTPPGGHGYGRELFAPFRRLASAADAGASIFTAAA